MTKKSLSDLLKEEVNKADAPDPAAAPPAASDEAAPAVTPKATASRRASRSSSSRRTTSRQSAKIESKATTAAKTNAAAEAALAQPQVEAVSPVAEVDLAQRVGALEKDLAAAQKDKAQLEKTIAGLQKDLATQQGRLFELKDSLDRAEAATHAKAEALSKTQAELDEAKATILKLAEAPAPAAPSTARRISGVDITPRRPVDTKAKPTYHRGVPEHTPQTGQPNPMLTDADIGWVD